MAFGAFRYTVATCTLLGFCRAFDVRLITEFRRNIEIATVFAPAGTVADTASGAEDEP